uniref:Ribosomal protein L29 n=1 Tax=Climaconeis sp. TaxID=2846830 RepID=A0A8F8SR34_9STRA|nr:ribosomal protein L29 [Climaconeis sp.]
MSQSKFNKINLFSNQEISETIMKLENQLIKLYIKKATRQNFKPHKIKNAKHELAQLKTLISIRLKDLEQKTNINKI